MKGLQTMIVIASFFWGTSVMAHFGMVVPENAIISPEKKTTELRLSFSHPFEGHGMELVKPEKFFVVRDGKQEDLLATLQPVKIMGHGSWASKYTFKRPGVYQFVMEPKPYWEPAEDVFIIHYTKTVVAAFGADTGWDEPAGVETEIVPLLRPFGNYAGNSFTGQVLLKGKPVAGAEIEVEYYNEAGQYSAPSDYHITQVIKADDNGVFSFTCPKAGWWGFAALSEADYKLKTKEGVEKGVEIGAVFWTYFDEMK